MLLKYAAGASFFTGGGATLTGGGFFTPAVGSLVEGLVAAGSVGFDGVGTSATLGRLRGGWLFPAAGVAAFAAGGGASSGLLSGAGPSTGGTG